MKQKLSLFISNSISITENETDFILSLFKPIHLKKNDFFIEIGDVCDQIAFVNMGLIRSYYLNYNNEDTTCSFSCSNEFVTSFSSFFSNSLATNSVQAIVSTELFVISKKDLELLYIKIPTTQLLFRKVSENLTSNMSKQTFLFLNYSARERYELFLKEVYSYFNLIPSKCVASYLGISTQHLLRIKKSL